MPTYLLTNRGTPADKTLEAARKTHNQAFAASEALARSLGDLSHTVYVPAHHAGTTTNEILILDVWNSVDGLNRFLAHLRTEGQAKGQASPLFSQRDAVIWSSAEGFHNYHFQAPYGKNDRILALVRGAVPSRAEAQAIHNDFMEKNVSKARAAGTLSHEAYFAFTPPGKAESLELLALDVWMDASGMAAYYQDAEEQGGFQRLFAEAPSVSTWISPAGEWAER